MGEGDDSLYNNSKINGSILGEDGNDYVYSNGAVSGDVLGGSGNDYVYVKADNATVYGDAGNDIIFVSGDNNATFGGEGDDNTSLIGSNNVAFGENGSGGTGYDKISTSGKNNTYTEMNELLNGQNELGVQVDSDIHDFSSIVSKIQAYLPDIEIDISDVNKALASLNQLDEIIGNVSRTRADIGFKNTLLNSYMKRNLTYIENIKNSRSIVRDADTAKAYNDLISQASLIEQTQLLQSQVVDNNYSVLSQLILSVAS